MGAGIHGGFSGTRGGRRLYKGTNKAAALNSVSVLPKAIQRSVKAFFKGGSNHYDSFSVEKIKNEGYRVKMENPGKVPGSRAVYHKILDVEGRTVRVYKETFDPNGNLVHRKEK